MPENLSNILNQSPIGILSFSEDWKINYINEGFLKFGVLYNFDTSALLEVNVFEHQIFTNVSLTEELQQLKEGFSFEKEIQSVKTINNSFISLIIKGSPLFDNNKFSGGVLIIEDLKVAQSVKDEPEVSTENIEKVLSRINDIIFITNNSGEIKFSAGNELKKLDLSNNFYNTNSILEITQNAQKDILQQKLDSSVQHRLSEKVELELKTKNGLNTFECRIEPLINKRGQVFQIYFFFSNITEELNKRQKLEKDSEELESYRTIIESVTDAVFAVDLDGRIKMWNSSAELLFDVSFKEIENRFFGTTLGLFDEIYFNKIKDDLIRYKFWKSNLTLVRDDHPKRFIDAKFTLAGETENTILILCSDITSKLREENKLKKSESKFREIVSESFNPIINLDKEGFITYVNSVFCSHLNFSEEELLGREFKQLISTSYFEKNDFNINRYEKDQTFSEEIPLSSRRGQPVIYLVNFTPTYSEVNQVTGFIGYLFNLEKVKSEGEDLKIFRFLFENSRDGIALEREGRIIMSNNSFADMFGFSSSEELVNRELLDLVSNNDVLKVSEYFRLKEQLKESPSRFEFLGKKKDKSILYSEFSIAPFEFQDKIYIATIARDVTERKRAQQAIRESEEKYRSLTENIDDFLYTFERTGKNLRPIFCTSSVEKVTGFTQTDFLGDSKLFLKIIYPDDFETVKNKLKNLMRSRIQLSEELEFRIINKHGNIVWVRNKINLVRSYDGQIQKIYGLTSDISLRKRAEDELKKSTENLVKLNETKDRFISIVSHDLRTPFSSILGFTDLLLKDTELTEDEKRQYVEFIQESSKSMLSLVNSLLDWTRLQTGRIRFEPERIEAKKIIEGAINALSGTAFQKSIEIKENINPDLFVFVDKNLVTQVFNNLISNAIKFTNPNGEIVVSRTPSDQTRFIEFSVKDNGIGIKPENIDKLFGVDTKFSSEGTAGEKGSGLGLSLVYEIIEKHGGKIWVESNYGNGTDFRFTLPIASANILLVDDNKTDRILYSKILKNITPDYTIESASNGKEALDIVFSSPPALIISDHLMPVMNGYDLVREVKKAEIKGKPPIIILSSDLDRQSIADYNDLGIEYVFQKPVNLSNFKQAVEKSLRKGLSNN